MALHRYKSVRAQAGFIDGSTRHGRGLPRMHGLLGVGYGALALASPDAINGVKHRKWNEAADSCVVFFQLND